MDEYQETASGGSGCLAQKENNTVKLEASIKHVTSHRETPPSEGFEMIDSSGMAQLGQSSLTFDEVS